MQLKFDINVKFLLLPLNVLCNFERLKRRIYWNNEKTYISLYGEMWCFMMNLTNEKKKTKNQKNVARQPMYSVRKCFVFHFIWQTLNVYELWCVFKHFVDINEFFAIFDWPNSSGCWWKMSRSKWPNYGASNEVVCARCYAFSNLNVVYLLLVCYFGFYFVAIPVKL